MTDLMADIRAKVSDYLARTGMAEEEFGRRALGRPGFVGRLGVQRTMTLRTADRVLRFMGETPIGPTVRRDVEAFLEVTGIRPERFGIDAVGSAWFVSRLGTQQSVRLTAVQQAREYMDRAADPSQRAVIAGMLEDGGESTCGAIAKPMSQSERKKGSALRVSDTDAEDPPAHHRREFLDTSEAAALLGLARRTLVRYRSRGVGPAYHRFHGRIVYTRTDLMSWALGKRQTTRESD